jgi:Rrf2 family transcriptional regulator, cysteine metabolism repressor
MITTINVVNTTDAYRLEALLEIAAVYPEPLTAAEVARRRRIPAPFLGRLLAATARTGILATARGPRGGVRLARRPDLVTLAEVAPLPPVRRAGGAAVAWLADALAGARRDVLERTTLADLVAIERRRSTHEDWNI